ncbi:MAG TPA: DUF2442 domain-containing protein [bacterium]|nr:DUF2442 domain-containing protein [bacterium]HQL63145.1 DUF2442 domain-containing protein [bacterium]
MNPRVQSVIPTDNYQLIITFTNGEQGTYDCTSLLNFGAFQELRNKVYSKQARVVDGTVVWPHEQDICPDTLYMESNRATLADEEEDRPGVAGVNHAR